MKTKCLMAVFLASAWCAQNAPAQGTSVNFSFTPNAGVTISDAYILDIVPQEAFAFATSISSLSGQYQLQGYGSDAQYLALIGVFTDSSLNTGIAFSLPGTATTGVAGTEIADNDTWSDFTTRYSISFVGSQSSIMNDLQNSEPGLLSEAFAYIQSGNGILNTAVYNNTTPPAITGEIVGFDGAEDLGSFTISTVPEPSPVAIMAVSSLCLFGWRLRRQHAIRKL